jgi:hypothetical protein
MATNLTGGKIPGATRIDSCCWLDGNDDDVIIEFWSMSGSILRSEYHRRTTESKYWFVPVHSEEFERLQQLAAGQEAQYSI